MRGRARLTTVPSSSAMLEPRMVASSTQRPRASPTRSASPSVNGSLPRGLVSSPRRRTGWGPGGVAPAGGHPAEGLEHDAVGGVDGELADVVGRRDLDDVDP